MDSATIAPPPDGFTLDAPPPPDGFTLDSAAQSNDVTPTSVVNSINEGARQINMGVVNTVPGLGYVADKVGLVPSKPGDEKPTLSQDILRMAGTSAGMTGAVLGTGLKALGGADALLKATYEASKPIDAAFSSVIKNFVKQATNMAINAPGKVAALETVGAVGAGAGGHAATQAFPDQPTATLLGQMGGGLAIPSAIALSSGWAKVSFMAKGIRTFVNHIFQPSADNTAELLAGRGGERASERLQRATLDMPAALNKAEAAQAAVLPGAKLSFPELVQEPGLLSLEKSVVESTDELSMTSQQHFSQINSVIRSNVHSMTPSDANPKDARIYLDNLLRERLSIASTKSQESIDAATPGISKEAASTLAIKPITGAYEDALKQESDVWSKVDGNLTGDAGEATAALKDELDNIRLNRVRMLFDDMPSGVRKLLGDYKTPQSSAPVLVNGKPIKAAVPDETSATFTPGTLSGKATMDELKSLRTSLLDTMRSERALDAPNRTKIALANRIQGALLHDMQKMDPTNDALDLARGFSADLNQRFRQGTVGQLLGFEKTGEAAVAPILTLQKTLGLGKLSAVEAHDAMIKAVDQIAPGAQGPATQGGADLRGYMEDYLANDFIHSSRTPAGEFKSDLALSYLKRNSDVLTRFPDLQGKFEAAAKAGSDNEVAQSIKDPLQAAAAIVSGDNPTKAITKIINSTDPRKTTQSLVKLLQGDENGQALPGMQRAFVDWFEKQALKSNAQSLDANGVPYYSGANIKEALSHPGVQQLMDGLLTKDQQTRLKQVMETASRMDMARAAKPSIEGIMGDPEGYFTGQLRKIISAAIFRDVSKKLGVNTLQGVSMFVQASNKLQSIGLDPARALIIDAVTRQDDALFKSLMLRQGTQKQKDAAQQTIKAWWMATVAGRGIDLSNQKSTIQDQIDQNNAQNP